MASPYETYSPSGAAEAAGHIAWILTEDPYV